MSNSRDDDRQTRVSSLIDVWDASTFDGELAVTLEREADLVQNYMNAERQVFLEYDLGRSSQRYFYRPGNPYSLKFRWLKKAISEQISLRTIRAWHYTRLTAMEVEKLRHEGIRLPTPDTLRSRLDLLVQSGDLSVAIADAIYVASPFHDREQLVARSNKFWMASHPIGIHDIGVRPLLARWGGEVASKWTRDPSLLARLAATGEPRVIEVAVPVALTQCCYSAGEAVLATFSRTRGCIPAERSFDLWVTEQLGPESVIRVHTEGEDSFGAMGASYPEGYVDVSVGWWDAYTAEDP